MPAYAPPPTADRLPLTAALAAVPHLHGERARLPVRDALLLQLRSALLDETRTPAEDARRLAALLTVPGSGFYGECLKAICDLSRGQKAPSAVQIERVLRRGA